MDEEIKKVKSEYFKERYKNNKERYKSNTEKYWNNYAQTVLGKQFVSEEEIKQVKNAYYRQYRKDKKEIVDKNVADYWERKKKKMEELDLRKEKQRSQRITFLDVIHESPNNENLVSNWLAFLLNPNNNGVGNKVMLALLRAIQREDIDIQNQDFLYIEREASTNNRKRMDILIKYSKQWFVIENKMDAQENEEQTKEYYNSVHKLKEDNEVVYIYLKPPYNLSKPVSEIFIELEYDKLLDELKQIRIEDYEEDEKYKYHFLEDFIIALEKSIKQNIPEYSKEDAKYIEENTQFISKMCQQIQQSLGEDSGFIIDPELQWGCVQIYKENWKNERYKGIHYELWSKTGLKVLGDKNAEICICLHAERNITEEMMEEFNKYNIERQGKSKTIEERFKVLPFDTEENRERAIKEIIKSVKEYDKKYTSTIDNVMQKF